MTSTETSISAPRAQRTKNSKKVSAPPCTKSKAPSVVEPTAKAPAKSARKATATSSLEPQTAASTKRKQALTKPQTAASTKRKQAPVKPQTAASTKRKQALIKPQGKNQKLGALGEDMACHYLADNCIEVIERNWKCKSGEADIIALEDDTLIFIEVKTRSQEHAGLPEYAVTKEKRARYEKIAISYLTYHKRPSGRVRFDVIAVRMTGANQCLLRHHRDAFSAGE